MDNMDNDAIAVSSQFQFRYNKGLSYLENYQAWRTLNQEERSSWNEEQLSAEEAELTFDKQYGDFK